MDERTSSGPMRSVGEYKSHEAVEGLLSLICADGPILDTTYGKGVFWKGSSRLVVGCDKSIRRAKSVACNFLHLPFKDESFKCVVFDPPFHPAVGSDERHRFSEMGSNESELETLFRCGLRECWRVSSRHVLAKCQGFVHNHKPNWMELWACDELGHPFEWLTSYRRQKKVSGRWKSVKSLRRNHATYLVFDKTGNYR